MQFIVKYAKQIIVFILAVVLLFLIFKVFKKISSATGTAADLLIDNAENEVIKNQTGISTKRIKELRGIANELGLEMETKTGTGWWDEASHLMTIWTLKDLMSKIKNPDEVSVVESIYKNEVTDTGKSLKDDINDYRKWMAFTGSLNSIPNYIYLK